MSRRFNPYGVAFLAACLLSCAMWALSIYVLVERIRAEPAPCICTTDTDCAKRCGGDGSPE